MRTFNLSDIELTKYLFFTGKGGVGKTSIACATAVGLADNGKKILLISTDPASNLQDVFNQTLNGHGTDIQEVPGLTVVNLDPEQAAAEYRESVIAPFRGKLPDSVIQNMEEQLSGSCTCLNDDLKELDRSLPKPDLFARISACIDRRIHRNYRIYPGNYVAYDWLNGTTEFVSNYTEEEKQQFMNYIEQQLAKINIPNKDEDFLREKLLLMYSNPLVNYLAACR